MPGSLDYEIFFYTSILKVLQLIPLFIYGHGHDQVFILIDVDDLMITENSSTCCDYIVKFLEDEFSLQDLDQLKYFFRS